MKQIVEIEVDVPEGYEVVGYRAPKHGESCLTHDFGEYIKVVGDYAESVHRVILKKKARVPKVGDVWVSEHGMEFTVHRIAGKYAATSYIDGGGDAEGGTEHLSYFEDYTYLRGED